jgi:FAD:protein FMN transferase
MNGILFLCHLIAAAGVCLDRPVGLDRFEFESKHMGTTFRIVLYAADNVTAEKAAKAAFARVAELDAIMSDYKKDSELMKLGAKFARQIGEPVRVSEDLFAVLAKAEEMSKQSGGAFDVTVGPVVQLWRHARRTQQLPEKDELAAALARVGYKNVQLDPKTRTVKLLIPGMQLDLGGIAKGYAADAALKLLHNGFGIDRALIAAAGDIACGQPPPGKNAWTVDIAPFAKGQKPRTLKLKNAAVSTSGDLEQFVEIGGVRYSHIVDPRTGLGITGRRSVTVIANSGITADSMTKAVMLMPPEKAMALVEKTVGAAASIVVAGKNEQLETTESKLFKEFLIASPTSAGPFPSAHSARHREPLTTILAIDRLGESSSRFPCRPRSAFGETSPDQEETLDSDRAIRPVPVTIPPISSLSGDGTFAAGSCRFVEIDPVRFATCASYCETISYSSSRAHRSSSELTATRCCSSRYVTRIPSPGRTSKFK